DAIRAGLLREEELPEVVRDRLGAGHSRRIDTLVRDIVATSWWASGDGDVSPQDQRIGMSEPVLAAANVLREFMFQRVYLWEGRHREAEQAQAVVRFLFEHYTAHPEEIESDFVIAADPVWRQVADYIAGMTDGFALAAASRLGYHA
ncbi:MAG: deoxyguanosinetriphosphate triphosphohydrolase, partial [Dehalococcoidia bacterium]